VDPREKIQQEGVYYLYEEGPEGPHYAAFELDDGFYLYAFSDEEKARLFASRWDAQVGYFPDPKAMADGLPEMRGLLLDLDPETEEAYRIRWEEL